MNHTTPHDSRKGGIRRNVMNDVMNGDAIIVWLKDIQVN